MAAGSVAASALRHRPRQAVLIVVLAAVVTGAAALGPLYARAVEQSVLRTVLAEAGPATNGVLVLATREKPPSPRLLARLTAEVLPPQFGRPVGGADARIVLRTEQPLRSRLVSRAGVCGHLRVIDGACAITAGQVMVSERVADDVGLTVGSPVPVAPEDAPREAAAVPLTVVGVYALPDLTTPYWAGRGQAAPQPSRPASGETQPTTVDDLLTPWATLATGRWPSLRTHLDIPLRPDRVDLRSLPDLAAATEQIDEQAATAGATATSSLATLIATAELQRDQARTIVPLLTVQLAVLGVVVLAFVAAAAVEQRRPEIALARLRGQGVRGAVGLLGRELGVLILAGSALGAGLGWLVARLAVTLWLRPDVGVEARWPVAVAVAASAAAGLVALAVAAAPTVRQPLTSLLRRIPPRASTLQVGVVEVGVATAAAAGLVTLLAGESGPVALLAPGLLAIAGGLLLAQATVPTAAPAARLLLRRGRLAGGLAAVQVARRPALRRLIAILTVACALLVFAVDAWAVSDRNRSARAAVEAGAAVVLTVDAASSTELRRAVLDVDRRATFATPVATVRSATETGPKVTAVEPDGFARIARWGGATTAAPAAVRGLRQEHRPPVTVGGQLLEMDVRFSARGVPRVGDANPQLSPFTLQVVLADSQGGRHLADFLELREGRGTYRAQVDCDAGCRVRQVRVGRTFGDFEDAEVRLEVTGMRVLAPGTGMADVDLDTATPGGWQVLPWQPTAPVVGRVDPGPTLVLHDVSFGVPVAVQRGDSPVVPTALVAGAVPEVVDRAAGAAEKVLAPDLTANDRAYAVAGRLPRVPRTGSRSVLADLAGLADGPSVAPALTSYEVWLAADDPDRERRLRNDLAARGLTVIGRDSAARHESALASEGATLALRLALLAGVVAVVLAAAVLVVGVATSDASRARDLAGLRLVGVPAAVIRASAVGEHVVVAVLGVLAGGALGTVAAQAALPHVPLFARPAAGLPLDLATAWLPVLLTVAGCLTLLVTVAVAVGRSLAAAGVPERLREGP